jgi:hypothetical protein
MTRWLKSHEANGVQLQIFPSALGGYMTFKGPETCRLISEAGIHTLIVAPLGDRPKTLKVIENLEAENDPSLRETIEHLRNTSDHADRSLRNFAVSLHGGEVRVVYPDKKDALSSIKQYEADGRTIREVPRTGD